MPTYAFRCKTCGSEYETHVAADRLDDCTLAGCDGIPRRVWAVNINRENLRAR
jgi:predicted nucleic acid-binding Zn ribbon protein